jgi:hypothetical protein
MSADFIKQRYAPLYTLASSIETAGTVLAAACVILGLVVFFSLSDGPALFGVFLFATAAFCTVRAANFGAAMLRTFADMALWTAPGLRDDEKIQLAANMTGTILDINSIASPNPKSAT